MATEIVEILACIADAVIAIWFISKFNNNNVKSINSFIFLLVYSAFNIANLYITIFSPISSVINLVLLVIYSLTIPESTWVKRIITPFAFEGALILVNTLIITLLGVITELEISQIANNRGLVRIIMLILCKASTMLVLSILLHIIGAEHSFDYQNVFLLILFPITLFFQLAILVKITLAYPTSELYGYFLAAIVSMLVAYAGIYYMVYQIIQRHNLQSQNELYQQMLRYEERRHADIEESLYQIQKIRHDIKHQILSVKSKMNDEDYTGANNEIERILSTVTTTGTIIKTKNTLVDYIVNTKLGKVENATIVVFGEVSSLSFIEDVDLSIILGNMIDNAVEAVEGINNAKIELSFSQKGYYQNIVCKNTIKTSVLPYNPELHTSKQDKEHHGYGVKSMKEIVEKYNGEISFFEEDGLFHVHIMLPVKKD